ncbi:glycosyltransferase family 2 protein [Wenyingzhuangia sp. IMCC45467]
MISICIPVYNYDVTKLVKVLTDQMNLLDKALELIVIDDGSKEQYKLKNKESLSNHIYIELPQNIGRSRIRNLFKQYANHPFLLFMDCDSMVVNKQFLANYIEAVDFGGLVYGGRIYPEKLPNKNKKLSWLYGREVESKKVIDRNKHPYLTFMTNNFLIDKSVFDLILFNEQITGYGHEDTLFGFELSKLKVKITHINNPVLNTDLECNKEFLNKTDQALGSLKLICLELTNKSEFYAYVKLLRFYNKMTPFQLKVINGCYFVIGKLIRQLLASGYYSKRLLDFYKIGYFTSINR